MKPSSSDRGVRSVIEAMRDQIRMTPMSTPRRGLLSQRFRGSAIASSLRAVLAGAVAVAVAAVIIGCGSNHEASRTAGNHQLSSPAHPLQPPRVSAAPACRAKMVNGRLVPPPLVETDAPASNALLSMLGSLRRPPSAADHIDLHRLNRYPYDVITIYSRYVRVYTGERGSRIAILPATICSLPVATPLTGHVHLQPTQVLVMQVLSNPLPRPIELVGTAADIGSAQANPGTRTATGESLQATVVPDGVARVVMDFTPPFLHHYSVTMTIHDNVGIAVRRPDYAPTSVAWYDNAGHLIKTYTDRPALQYDDCLAQHKKNCSD